MSEQNNKFSPSRVKDYITEAISEKKAGPLGVGLDFIASCAEASGEDSRNSARRLDSRIFYLFCNKVYHDSLAASSLNAIDPHTTGFFKRIICNVKTYAISYPEGTIIGNFIRYADRKGFGYAKIGEALAEIDFTALEHMARNGCGTSQISKKGAEILAEYFASG